MARKQSNSNQALKEKQESRRAEGVYLKEAKSWDAGRLDNVRASERALWLVALVGLVVAAVGAAGFFVVYPFKEVRPYFVRINERTGYIDTVDESSFGRNYQQILVEHFIVKFVEEAERRVVGIEKQEEKNGEPVKYFQKVQKPSMSLKFLQFFSASSVANRIIGEVKNSGIRNFIPYAADARVKSIRFLNSNTAEIHFDLEEVAILEPYNQKDIYISPKVVLMTFEYGGDLIPTDAEISDAKGIVNNPIGFKVLSYNVNSLNGLGLETHKTEEPPNQSPNQLPQQNTGPVITPAQTLSSDSNKTVAPPKPDNNRDGPLPGF